MFRIILALVFSTAAGISLFQDSPEELGKEFGRAQKLMVTGDFDQAVALYRQLMTTPGNWLLRPERVQVEVGEEPLPLRVAAAYQVAGSFRRRGEERMQADTAQGAGEEDLRRAAESYRELVEAPLAPPLLRERAAYQVGQCLFKSGEYRAAIAAYERFQGQFPESEYAGEARYRTGWAYFHLEEWETAAGIFARVAGEEGETDQGGRALFQAGECYARLGRWPAALKAFEALAGRFDPQPYAGKRRAEDVMLALRQDLEATERELFGKAHIRVGDAYRQLDSLQAALTWYQRTVERFPTEEELMRTAYLRLAETWAGQGRVDEALAAYQRALEEIAEPFFRAQVQAEYMGLAHASGRFAEAAAAYQSYAELFADQAEAVGISVEQARLLRAESLRQEAEGTEKGAARDSVWHQALGAYQDLLEQEPPDSLAAEAMLGMGICWQELDSLARAEAQFARVEEQYPGTRAGIWAGLKGARLQWDRGDSPGAIARYETLRETAAGEMAGTVRLELGLIQAQRGAREAAAELLAGVKPGTGEYARARLALAQLYGDAGAWNQAEGVLEEAMGQEIEGKMGAELVYTRAALAFQQEEYGEAQQWLATVDTTRLPASTMAEYLYMRGACRYQSGDIAGAFQDLQACRERGPTPAVRQQAVELLGLCLAEKGDLAAGEAQYRQWIETAHSEEEREELELGLAQFYFRAGAQPECAAWLQQVEFGDPERKRESRLLLAESLLADQAWEVGGQVLGGMGVDGLTPEQAERRLYLMGVAAMNRGEYERAVVYLKELLARGPGEDVEREARRLMGRCWFTLGRHEEAAAVFLDFVEQYPEDSGVDEAAYLAGENLYLLAEYERAAAAYARVREGEYRSAAALARAWCLLELEQEEAFLAQVEQVQEEFPDSDQARAAAVLAGDYFYNKQDYPAARRAYAQVVERYPGSSEARLAGDLRVELRDLEADLVYQAGMATFDLGEYEQAALLLQAVIRRYPDTLSEMAARCNLGVAYERLGKWREAVEVYDETLQAAGDKTEFEEMSRFAQEHREWIAEYRL